MPATSSKVTRPCRSVSRRARDLPKPIALPPPDCIWRIMKIQTPMKRSSGNQEIRMPTMLSPPSSTGLAAICTSWVRSVVTSSGS